jgi:hypothetical protein
MFSPPLFGNSLVAANMIIQSAEASRVGNVENSLAYQMFVCDSLNFLCLLVAWNEFFRSRAPNGEFGRF